MTDHLPAIPAGTPDEILFASDLRFAALHMEVAADSLARALELCLGSPKRIEDSGILVGLNDCTIARDRIQSYIAQITAELRKAHAAD